jgi:phosphatidylglycerophosphate synthase
MLLGLPILGRAVQAAARAGFGKILILTPDPVEAKALVRGVPASVHPLGEPLPSLPAGRLVLLAGQVVPSPRWLKALLEMPLRSGQVYCEGDAAAVIDAADAPAVLAAVPHASRVPDVVAGLGRRVTVANGSADPEGRVALAGPGDLRAAEGWLLRGLIKESEGFMSRHVERRISLAISRRLVSTPVGPNLMTGVCVGIGLLGAPCFLSQRPAWQLAGALLFLLHSILDGCDGELARLRHQESRWGGLFDFWGDNVVHVAVFLCVALGWSRAVGAAWPLALGAVAAAGTVGAAAFVTRHTMLARPADGPLFTSVLRSRASRRAALVEAVSNRDFIYLVVALAAFGKAAWFLVLAAVGAPIYFVLLVWAGRSESLREEEAR